MEKSIFFRGSAGDFFKLIWTEVKRAGYKWFYKRIDDNKTFKIGSARDNSIQGTIQRDKLNRSQMEV